MVGVGFLCGRRGCLFLFLRDGCGFDDDDGGLDDDDDWIGNGGGLDGSRLGGGSRHGFFRFTRSRRRHYTENKKVNDERTNDGQFVIIYVIKFKPFARVIAAIKRLKERRIVYIWDAAPAATRAAASLS